MYSPVTDAILEVKRRKSFNYRIEYDYYNAGAFIGLHHYCEDFKTLKEAVAVAQRMITDGINLKRFSTGKIREHVVPKNVYVIDKRYTLVNDGIVKWIKSEEE